MSEGLFNITFEIEGDSLDEIIHYIEDENKPELSSTDSMITRDPIYRTYASVSREKTGLPHDPGSTNISIEEENETLLNDILELLDSEVCEFPKVILLFGISGAGKSALINTIHKALTGQYFPIAKHGKGEAPSITMALNRYENCGISLQRIFDKSKKERMNDTIRKLPHILDCSGLPDVNSRELIELLEVLIGGYIPPGTQIPYLQEIQTKNGEGSLKILYKEPKPEWKVTKIVFVQGCVDAIPRNLIECLKKTLGIVDEDTFISKYQADIFVLVTKCDLVEDSKDINLRRKVQEQTINMEELEKVEADLARQFNFEGVPEFNTLRWVSLTQNVGLDNPLVENIALQFLKQMVVPSVPRVQHFATVMDRKRRIQLGILRFRKNVSWCCQQTKLLLIVAAMVAVLAVVYYLLVQTATPDSSTAKSNVSSG
ncbi:uncharacterized protein LOC123561138 [Mercenaria mercenaria]|uniref:uncharacterized protein LOC123561138 n=1 Tax=Mercenaria mercenaria TaxID=6596 RepID=UPI00234E91EE|nr:uncharacterized protein LOC123561138 [Mercenaria mercenaria]